MRSIRGIAVSLLAAAAVGLGATAATSGVHGQPSGPPDSYVAYWDDIGSKAFSAAALSLAEGHVIFAYLATPCTVRPLAQQGLRGLSTQVRVAR